MVKCRNMIKDNNKRVPIEYFFNKHEELSFRISPSGTHISFLRNYNNRLSIIVKDLKNHLETELISFSDISILNYTWISSTQIAYLKDNHGNECYNIFIVDINEQEHFNLTPFKETKSIILDTLIYDQDHILITMNRRNKKIFDVYKANIHTGKLFLVELNPGNVTRWIVDFNGQVKACVVTDGLKSSVLFKKHNSNTFELIFSGDFKENKIPLSFYNDNKSLIVASNSNRDKYAIYKIDPLEQTEELLYENKYVDVNKIIKSAYSKKIIAIKYIEEKMKYKFLDEGISITYHKLLKRIGCYEIEIVDINIEETIFVIVAYNDKNPGIYYMYDSVKDELMLIAKINTFLEENEMSDVTAIKYLARDGVEINGYLTLPKQIKKATYPLIVNPHGGPWSRNIWVYSPEVQFLANRGYAVLQVNFRGSTGYGRKFKELGFKQWGKAMQDDITDGVEWLINKGIVDKNNIAIYGASYGGYASLAGVVYTPNLYSCAISIVGPSNLFSLIDSIPEYWKPMKQRMCEMIGDPDKDKEYMREYSPIFHVGNIIKPVFIIHGSNDPRVSKNESENLINELKLKGKSFKCMIKENEGHGFKKHENIIEMYEAIEQFLQNNLN